MVNILIWETNITRFVLQACEIFPLQITRLDRSPGMEQDHNWKLNIKGRVCKPDLSLALNNLSSSFLGNLNLCRMLSFAENETIPGFIHIRDDMGIAGEFSTKQAERKR